MTYLQPGTIYPTLDEAMQAASCLCGLDPAGATIYGTTTGPDVAEASGEAYIVACAAIRKDGSTWLAPTAAHYGPIYTITRAPKMCHACGQPFTADYACEWNEHPQKG